MKNWNFKLKKPPKEVIEKLTSKLNSIGGFSFKTKNTNTFSFRKRILYPWYYAFQNWTVVNGEFIENNVENITEVKISFKQHFLIKLIIVTHLILGLGLVLGLFLATDNQSLTYILGGLVIAFGIIIWITATRKFNNDSKKYKVLITKTLGV
ncbi:DUF423 domain-containing protein [Maribacter sp. PR1]|uniref:DUF423 domain-containing protein n=1 Tax=Maribacter cobaltidurans TaxID=1178778 RepID=A0ABU7IYK3_9FLAO|nr:MULTISPECIES: DUF423 domain-containing protein [Maribacter]MDC6390659.1 DUF423 domain-containing protein [Maribacter sp. PR1]MEE1978051.1 DUF423 domain-containing protein [Maribacter cobaltidurans]